MNSKQHFWISILFVFSSTFLLAFGVFVVLSHFFSHVRFTIAELLNDGHPGVLFTGCLVLLVGLALFSAFFWLTRKKFIQIKLADGAMGLGQDLIEKTVGEFWQEHFGVVPVVAIDGEHQIEVFYEEIEDAQLAMVEKNLSLHLLNKLGAQPIVVLTLAVK